MVAVTDADQRAPAGLRRAIAARLRADGMYEAFVKQGRP
jgi:hypothetical protein